jgi:virginiamycin B lyase
VNSAPNPSRFLPRPLRRHAPSLALACIAALNAACTGSGGDAARHTSLPSTIVVKEFPIPGGVTEGTGSGPDGITAGPDRNIWFAEGYANKVASLSRTGRFTEYAMGRETYPQRIVVGPDGRLWFAEYNGNKVGTITTHGIFAEYAMPGQHLNAYSIGAVGIAAGPDGNVWFTELLRNKVGSITRSGKIVEYTVPTANSSPYAITAGPDGNLWFTEQSAGKIATITPAGKITEYAVPYDTSWPSDITLGPDGRLWFTDGNQSLIGAITTSGSITTYAIPPPQVAYEITKGRDGNLWFTTFTTYNDHKIGVIATDGTAAEFEFPASKTQATWGIAAGSDGNLWFTQDYAIGEVVLHEPSRVGVGQTASRLAASPAVQMDKGHPADGR